MCSTGVATQWLLQLSPGLKPLSRITETCYQVHPSVRFGRRRSRAHCKSKTTWSSGTLSKVKTILKAKYALLTSCQILGDFPIATSHVFSNFQRLVGHSTLAICSQRFEVALATMIDQRMCEHLEIRHRNIDSRSLPVSLGNLVHVRLNRARGATQVATGCILPILPSSGDHTRSDIDQAASH